MQLEGIPCSDTCGNPSFKGDNYCNDENNNCGCEWDGGDCCGDYVNTQWCSACECLDPDPELDGCKYQLSLCVLHKL